MSSLRNNYFRLTPDSRTIESLTMSDDGSLTGNKELNVNGSVTPQEFYITPPSDSVIYVQQVGLKISDNGNPNWDNYGDIPGPLSNGTLFWVERNGVKRDVTLPFVKNADFIRNSRTFDLIEFANTVRILKYTDLFNEYCNGILLKGSTNDKFGLRIQDDLTGLLTHECQVKGYSQLNIVS